MKRHLFSLRISDTDGLRGPVFEWIVQIGSLKAVHISHFFNLHYFAFALRFSFPYVSGSSQVCTSQAFLVDIIKRSVFEQRSCDWKIELAHSYCTQNCKLVKLVHKRSRGGYDVGSDCVENTNVWWIRWLITDCLKGLRLGGVWLLDSVLFIVHTLLKCDKYLGMIYR